MVRVLLQVAGKRYACCCGEEQGRIWCACCCMWQASGARGTDKCMVRVLLQVVAGKRCACCCGG